MDNNETSDGGGSGFFGNVVNNLSSLAGTAATIAGAVRGSLAPVANATRREAPAPMGTMSTQKLIFVGGLVVAVLAFGGYLLLRKKG